MSMIDDGGEANVAPTTPLFASSWLALYFLLKQKLENRRDGGTSSEKPSEPPPPPRPN
jgi:hypothetical protein